MREIKFRAWDAYDSKWKYFIIGQSFGQLGESVYKSLCLEGATFHEFTGLLDKNGKEIYEGDIVKISYGMATVKFINECGAFMLQWIDDYEANMELVAFSNKGYRLGRSRAWEKDIPEVIGNIYENIELLKS